MKKPWPLVFEQRRPTVFELHVKPSRRQTLP
jgi:hypothetical protein